MVLARGCWPCLLILFVLQSEVCAFDCFTLLHRWIGQARMGSERIHTLNSLAAATETVWLEDRVEVMYFPGEWHMKLRLGDDVYSAGGGPFVRTSYEALDRLSQSTRPHTSLVRFQIRVTEEELAAMMRFVKKWGVGISCAHAVCRALNRNTGAWVPLPLSLTPTVSALWLAFEPGSAREPSYRH